MTKSGVVEQGSATSADSPHSVSSPTQDSAHPESLVIGNELKDIQSHAPLLESPIQQAIERNLDQRQEHQLYASVWGHCGTILLKVIPSVTPEYRRQAEELQNQIDLVVAEKKKRGKCFDPRDPRLFDRMVSVLGEQGAQDLITSIDTAIGKHGVGLQNNPKAVAELLTEISRALTSGGVLAKLGVSAQAVERELVDWSLGPKTNVIARSEISNLGVYEIPASGKQRVGVEAGSFLESLDNFYNRLGAAEALVAYAEAESESTVDGLADSPRLTALKQFAEEHLKSTQSEIAEFMSREATKTLMEDNPELGDIFISADSYDLAIEQLRAEIKPGDSKEVISIIQRRIKEIQEAKLHFQEARSKLVASEDLAEILKQPDAAILISQHGIHPRLVEQLISGRQKIDVMLMFLSRLESEHLTADSIVMMAAKNNFAPTDLEVMNNLIKTRLGFNSLQDLALEYVVDDSQKNLINRQFLRLERQEGPQILAELLHTILNEPNKDLASKAIDVARVVDSVSPDMWEQMHRHIRNRKEHGEVKSMLTDLFQCSHSAADPKSDRVEGVLRLIEQRKFGPDSSMEYEIEEDAYHAALMIRLELIKDNPDASLIEQILLKESDAEGDRLGISSSWLRRLGQCWKQQAIILGEHSVGLEEALSSIGSSTVQGLMLIAEGREADGEEFLISGTVQQTHRQEQLIQDLAIRYARTMGELEGLKESADTDEERASIEARELLEEEAFAEYLMDPTIGSYFDRSSSSYPFQEVFLDAKKLAMAIDADVAVYHQVVSEASLPVDTLLEDLSRRFQTQEAGARFQRAFKKQYGIDIRTYLVKLEDPKGEWHTKVDTDPVWQARKEIVEAAFSADRTRLLAGGTRLYILKGDAVSFHRLQTLYSTMPDIVVEAALGTGAQEGSSLESILADLQVDIPKAADPEIDRRDIVEWARAKVNNHHARMQAVELHVLLRQPLVSGKEKILDAQRVITALTSEGTGIVAQAKYRELKEAYKAIYSEDIDTVGFLENALKSESITVLPRDIGALNAIFSGNMQEVERELFNRAFHRYEDVDLRDDTQLNFVDLYELNRLVQIINPERIAELRGQLEGQIASDPVLNKLGITSLQGYIYRCSPPELGHACNTFVERIINSNGEGVDIGEINYFSTLFDSSRSILMQMDYSARELQRKGKTLLAMTDGARSSLEDTQDSYNTHYWNPIARVTGHTEELRAQQEREARTVRQGERAQKIVENAVADYGRLDDYRFEDNQWIVSSSFGLSGDRARYIELVQQSLNAMERGEFETSKALYEESVEIARAHLTIEGDGLANAESAIHIHYKDALSRNHQNIIAFQGIEGNYNQTIKGLQYTRTAVFVGGALIATGGLGAGVLVTTASIGGIAVGSHALEGSLHYSLGNKDGGTAFSDASWGAAGDVEAVWTAASLSGLVRALPRVVSSIPSAGGRTVQFVTAAPRNIVQTMKMHRSSISQHGFFKSVFRGSTLHLVDKSGKVIKKARVVGQKVRTDSWGRVTWNSVKAGKLVFSHTKANLRASQIGKSYSWIKPSGRLWWPDPGDINNTIAAANTARHLLTQVSPVLEQLPPSIPQQTQTRPPDVSLIPDTPPIIQRQPSQSLSRPPVVEQKQLDKFDELVNQLDEFVDEGQDLLKNYEGLITGAFARLFGSNEGLPPSINQQPPPPVTPPTAGSGSGDIQSGSTGGGEPPSGGSGPVLKIDDDRGQGNSYTAAVSDSNQSSLGEATVATIDSTTFSPQELEALGAAQEILNDLRIALQDPREALQHVKESIQPQVEPYIEKVREGLVQFEKYVATLAEATTKSEQNSSVNLTAEQIAQVQETAQALFNQSTQYLSDLNTSANELAEKIGAFVAEVSVNTSGQQDVETVSNTVANVSLNAEAEGLVAQDSLGVGQQASQIVTSQAESQSNSLRKNEKDSNRDQSENSQVDGVFMHAQRERLAESQRAANRNQDSNLESIDRGVSKKDAGSEQAGARETQSGVADGTFMHVRREQEARATRIRNSYKERDLTGHVDVLRRFFKQSEEERSAQDIAETKSSEVSHGESVAQIVKDSEQKHFVEVSQKPIESPQQIAEAQNVAPIDETTIVSTIQQVDRRQRRVEQSEKGAVFQDQRAEQPAFVQKEAKAMSVIHESAGGDVSTGSGPDRDAPRYSSSHDTASSGDSPGPIPRKAKDIDGSDTVVGAIHENASLSRQETVSTEAQRNAVDTILTTVGVARSGNFETPALDSVTEDFGGQAPLEVHEGAISANVEQLIVKLSEQVGEQVKEASTFLATFEDAPRILTTDSSSTLLLDGANISVSNATSLLGDVIESADSASAKQVMHAKQQRARNRRKYRREIEVIIQVLLTRQMEALKREKLLRMLLTLGISEVEYRGLVTRLGELEVAKQAREAESRKMQEAEKQAQAILVEGTLKAPEPPTMKDKSSDPSAPPTMKSPGTTRGNLYRRLLEEKAKAS